MKMKYYPKNQAKLVMHSYYTYWRTRYHSKDLCNNYGLKTLKYAGAGSEKKS